MIVLVILQYIATLIGGVVILVGVGAAIDSIFFAPTRDLKRNIQASEREIGIYIKDLRERLFTLEEGKGKKKRSLYKDVS